MSDLIAQYPQDTADTSPLRSMQEVAMSDSNASKMLSTYNVAYWGGNYYDVNELGHISVCPDRCAAGARRSDGVGITDPGRSPAAPAGVVLFPADPATSLALD